MALIAYMLWIGVAIASGAYIRGGERGTAMGAIILAVIACTVHIRISLAKAHERTTNNIGAMIRINELHDENVSPFRRQPGAR